MQLLVSLKEIVVGPLQASIEQLARGHLKPLSQVTGSHQPSFFHTPYVPAYLPALTRSLHKYPLYLLLNIRAYFPQVVPRFFLVVYPVTGLKRRYFFPG